MNFGEKIVKPRLCYFFENLLRCFIATKHLAVPKLARTDHRIVLGCGYLTSRSPCGRALSHEVA